MYNCKHQTLWNKFSEGKTNDKTSMPVKLKRCFFNCNLYDQSQKIVYFYDIKNLTQQSMIIVHSTYFDWNVCQVWFVSSMKCLLS